MTTYSAELFAVFTIALLSACASTHQLRPEASAVSPDSLQTRKSLSGTPIDAAAWPQAQWWRAYGDPQLDELIDERVINIFAPGLMHRFGIIPLQSQPAQIIQQLPGGLFGAARQIGIFNGKQKFPAGVARMPIWRFCLYTFLGSLIWCALLAWIGVKLGQHWDTLGGWFHRFDAVILAALLIAFGLYVWRHVRHLRDE